MFRERSPISYLPISCVNDENIQVVKRTLQTYKNAYTNIPVNKMFSQAELMKLKEHKWMENCVMTLVPGSLCEIEQTETLEKIYSEIMAKAIYLDTKIGSKKPLPVIAIDFEAYNLSTRIYNLNGHIDKTNPIVGVGISTGRYTDDKEYAWYFPLDHTESDDIINFDANILMKFIEKVLLNSFTIYHNANFDREILAAYKVKMSDKFADTNQLAIHVGWMEDHMQAGLKYISQELLDRKMIEIHELIGTKEHIQFDRLPAQNAVAYGCSDVINTHAIFLEFINYCNDKEGYPNPFEYQKNAVLTDFKSMDHLRSMFRLGLPLDFPIGEAQMKTLLRRQEILWDEIYSLVPDTLSITSPEQLGIYIGTKLESAYRKYYGDKQSEDKLIKNFTIAIKDMFVMERKTKKLKTGEKITYNCDKHVLKNIWQYISELKWIDEGTEEHLATLAEKLLDYNDIDSMINYKKIVRHGYSDSFGFSRFSGGLRNNGASCVVGSTKIKIKYKENREIEIQDLPGYIKQYGNIQVETPDGWQYIGDYVTKEPKLCYIIKTENGFMCESSETHLFQKADGNFEYTKNLKILDELLTREGISKIVEIRPTEVKPIFDIEVLHENHRYYTDGICSHNTTSRYSNLSAPAGNRGALERVQIRAMTAGKKGVYKPASPAAGVNIQGISSTPPKEYTAKRIKRLPDTVMERLKERTLSVEISYREMMEEIE